jgi:hypothetical protein
VAKFFDAFAGVKAVVGAGADQSHGKTGGHIVRAKDYGQSRVCMVNRFQYLYIKVRGRAIDQNAVGARALDCCIDALQILYRGYIEVRQRPVSIQAVGRGI